LALNIARLATRHWSNPVRELRSREGLRRHCDPVFRDKFSPDLVLALFSRVFAPKQSDWPSQTVQPGFVRFENTAAESAEISKFLAAGEPPIIFTQGSTAVHNAGDFYRDSATAARSLGKRALLVGAADCSQAVSDDLLIVRYANYSHVFPSGLINVHQGGSGTIGEALRAGRPMLVVPYGWDQPDNAMRIERLGPGLHLPRQRYSAKNAEDALRRLIEDPSFAIRAGEMRNQLESENGLRDACNATEALL
jgi:UDP:flavonoid glycosyltransferase YjiC (YdhE family)